MLIINLVVVSVPVFVTGLSADEPSSAPALAGSRGVFFLELFVARFGWDSYTDRAGSRHHG